MGKSNVHHLVGKKYKNNDECLKTIEEIDKNPPEVDIRLLLEMANEAGCYTIGDIVGMLEMNEVPMTDAVRKLGICAGILYA